jgi:CRP/FNR family transcriptional regulator, cyclic AMP receptor protein
MKPEEFLKRVELFSGLSQKNLNRVSKLCTLRSYKAGDEIVKQGNPGLGLFLITSGKVRIVKKTKDGRELEIATHVPPEFIGEMSVLDGAVRTASVIAVEDTECYAIVSWDFNALMKSYPDIALEILPVIVKRFRETNDKLIGTAGSASS